MTQEQAQADRFVRVYKAKIGEAERTIARAQGEIEHQTELLRGAEAKLAEVMEKTARSCLNAW